MNFSYHLLQNWEYSTSKSQQHNESCCIFKILQCQLWFQKQAQNWGHGNFRQVTTTLWSRNLFQEDCDYLKWQQRMFFSNTEHRIKPQMQLQWWRTSVNNLSAVQSLVLKSLQTWNSQGGWQSFLHPDSSHFPINWNHGVFSYPRRFFGWFLVGFFVVGLFFFFLLLCHLFCFLWTAIVTQNGTQTGKRSFGSDDSGVTDDNPVLQNPLTNTKSNTGEWPTAPLLVLLCLQ